MAGIHSFHDSMTLDRGILGTLQSPEPGVHLPSPLLAPPGALRGIVEEGQDVSTSSTDRLLEWAAQAVETPTLLTPGGFLAALGAAAKSLGDLARSSTDPHLQPMARACARITQDQLQLVRLAEYNRNALVQG